MTGINRREFVTTTIGGAVLTLGAAVWARPLAAAPGSRIDIGAARSLKITCVSEVGWRDTGKLMADMKAGGGPNANQWDVAWDPDNSAGSCSLVEVEALDGRRRKFLLDCGWNPAYMSRRFEENGIDRMLKDGEIEFLFLSHEHLDHLWGLEAVLRLKPDITIIVPGTFQPQAYQLIEGAEFAKAGAKNAVHHTGKLIRHSAGGVHPLMDGVASATFDLPILLGIQGEQSIYANLEGKGVVCVTGCCHQTILKFADYAVENLAAGDRLHGLYGGLHIAPFGPLKPEQEEMVRAMGGYGFGKIACNHCTGLPAVEMMTKLGYPVVKGTGRFGSESDLYVGNGDTVTF